MACHPWPTTTPPLTRPPLPQVRAETKIGDVYVSFGDTDSAFKCYSALHGRMFGGNQVVGIFMEPEKFAEIQSAM